MHLFSSAQFAQYNVFVDNVSVAVCDLLLTGIPFLETSALNGSNVERAFVSMSSKIKINVDLLGLSGVANSKGMRQTGSMQSAQGDRKKSACGCS